MKLNKLLPIATITSVATIVTPLVSCNSGKSALSFDFCKGRYNPVVPRKTSEKSFNETTALTEYLSDVNSNKKIGASDIMASTQYGYDVMIEQSIPVTTYNKTIEVTSVDVDKHFVSMNISYNVTADVGEIVSYGVDITLTNFEYICIYDNPGNEGSDYYWKFQSRLDNISQSERAAALTEDHNWAVKGTWYYDGPENAETQTVDINWKNFSVDGFANRFLIDGMLYQDIRFESDYFQDMTYSE